MNPLPVLAALAALLSPVLLTANQPVDPRAHPSPYAVASHGARTSIGVWPLQPRPPVVRGFDPPSNPYAAGHRGVDLLGRVGQTVHAALAGTVTFTGSLAGVGIVVVDHGTTRTTYQPVTTSVPVGTVVMRGASIGVLAQTGSHCAPAACLHWGWIRNIGPAGPQRYLDPLGLVGAVAVRLLPLPAGS